MHSPFPGMDPYLEDDLFQEFSASLVHQVSQQLLPMLASKYVALLNRRYVSDVAYTPAGYAAVVASPSYAPQLSVEIRDVAERRLVTVIEILSPANKTGEGTTEYNHRRIDLLQTKTHLLEIDLLRGGTRITLTQPVPAAPYYVYLSRAERRPFTLVWAVQLAERLPNVPVPLLAPDPDVTLSLQAAVDACFALVGYERLMDYTKEPPPPEPNRDERAWLAEIVRAAGAS